MTNIFKSGFINRWTQLIAALVLVGMVVVLPVPAEAGLLSSIKKAFKAVVNAVVYTVQSVVSIATNVVTGNFSQAVHETGCLVGAGIELLGFEDFRCKKPGAAVSGGGVNYGGGATYSSSGSGLPFIAAGNGTTVDTNGIRIPTFGFSPFGGNINQNITAQLQRTNILLTTVSAVPNTVLAESATYTLRGTAFLGAAAAGNSAFACFQIRSIGGSYSQTGCDTSVKEPLPLVGSGDGAYSFTSPLLAPNTAYRFRAFAFNRTTGMYYWGEEIEFVTSIGVPVYASELTSALKRLEITFLANRPEETNTVSVTTNATNVPGGVTFQVGTLLDPAGTPVVAARAPLVYLDNSLSPGTMKSLSSFPSVTNIKLRFPGSLATGIYRLPVTTLYGTNPVTLDVPVAITNLDPSYTEQ